jgi:hypothetical protein
MLEQRLHFTWQNHPWMVPLEISHLNFIGPIELKIKIKTFKYECLFKKINEYIY